MEIVRHDMRRKIYMDTNYLSKRFLMDPSIYYDLSLLIR